MRQFIKFFRTSRSTKPLTPLNYNKTPNRQRLTEEMIGGFNEKSSLLMQRAFLKALYKFDALWIFNLCV